MNIRDIPISKILPAKYNPRKDLRPEDPEYKKLKQSIDKFGAIDPLIWNERTGNLVGGHQRFKILKARGDKTVTVSIVNLDDNDERALNIALNKISGDWDWLQLESLLTELKVAGYNTEYTGFDVGEMLNTFGEEYTPEKDPELEEDSNPFSLKGLTDENDDLLMYNEAIVFPAKNYYGIPELRSDRLGHSTHFNRVYRKEIDGDNTEGSLLLWGKRPPDDINLVQKMLPCFYVWDEGFEFVWQHASAVGRKFLQLGITETMQTDYSTWLEDPRAVQLWAVYRNQWLGRFWQEMGINIIPNITYSDIDSLQYTLCGLPKEIPVACIQLRTSHNDVGKLHDKACLFEIFRKINVHTLLCHAEQSAIAYHKEPLSQVKKLVQIEPLMSRRAKPGPLAHSRIRDLEKEVKKHEKKKQITVESFDIADVVNPTIPQKKKRKK